jgi:hypothetical protein
MLLEAENILVHPHESVVIGITPKSTGNHLLNNNEKKAMEFLNISKELVVSQALSLKILPGSPSLTAWLISMAAVKMYFEGKYNLLLNYNRYQLLQIDVLLKGFFSQKKSVDKKELFEVFKKICLRKKVLYFTSLFFIYSLKRLIPSVLKHKAAKIYNRIFALSSMPENIDISVKETFSNIFEVFEHHERGKLHTKEEIKTILAEARLGTPIDELCLVHGISQNAFSHWKCKFGDRSID